MDPDSDHSPKSARPYDSNAPTSTDAGNKVRSTEQELYVHTLLFRCGGCHEPVVLTFTSADRNPEKFAATALDLLCKCGWLKRVLGMEAVGHYVNLWEHIS